MDAWDIIAEGTDGTGRPVASEPNSHAQDVEEKTPGTVEEHNPSESSGVAAEADVASLLPPPPKAVKTLLEGDLMVYVEEVLQLPCFDLFLDPVCAGPVRINGANCQKPHVPCLSSLTGSGHWLRRNQVPGGMACRDAGGGQGAPAVHHK